MLYNIELDKKQNYMDCWTCPYYNERMHQCEGLNKCCFEFDEKTQTCIDGVTRMPIRISRGDK